MTESLESGPEHMKSIYRRLISEKKTFMEIAEHLGTDGKTAYYYILEHGLLPEYRKSLRKGSYPSLPQEHEIQRKATLERLVNESYSQSAIGRTLHISKQRVFQLLHKYGLYEQWKQKQEEQNRTLT